MGTADLACASLQALAQGPDFDVLTVITQPDRPKGRDLKLQPSSVKALALKLNLPVLQPERARQEGFIAELRPLAPDLIVVAAYGQILPQAILDLPRFGCLNVHTSILPRYRGAAPIQWALLNDDLETGVTIMKMDAGLGTALLVRTIPDYIAGKISPRPQPAEGASYARKITKEDGRLDWTQPARRLWNRIRAFTPWPGAFTFQLVESKPIFIKIWQADIIEHSGAAAPGEILEAGKQGILVRCGHNAL